MGRLDRKYGNPYQKERKGIKCPRHFALQDLDARDLDLLTRLLILPQYTEKSDLELRWLQGQEQIIRKLPYELVFPRSRREKIAIWLGSKGMCLCPGVAILCSHHSGLDPRVIRNLLNLILVEADVRTLPIAELYDELRQKDESMLSKMDPGQHLSVWLDCVLQIAQMRLPSRRDVLYRDIHGGLSHANRPFWTKCEACAVAKVAGDPTMLAYLRTSVLIRKGKSRKTGRVVRPRLLRIIRSWLKHYDEGTRNAVTALSEQTVMRYLRFREMNEKGVAKDGAAHVEQEKGSGRQQLKSDQRVVAPFKQNEQNTVAASPAAACRGLRRQAQKVHRIHAAPERSMSRLPTAIRNGQTYQKREGHVEVQLPNTPNTLQANAASRIYFDGHQLIQDCDEEIQPLCSQNEFLQVQDNHQSDTLPERPPGAYQPELRWSGYTNLSARPAPLKLRKERPYKPLSSDDEGELDDTPEQPSRIREGTDNAAGIALARAQYDKVKGNGEQMIHPPRPTENAYWGNVSTQNVSVQQHDETVRSEIGSIMAVSPMSSMSNLSLEQPCNAWSYPYSDLAKGDHAQKANVLGKWT